MKLAPWTDEIDDWDDVILEVAGFSPAEAQRIKRSCTDVEIVKAYRSLMARKRGVGYKLDT